MILKTCQATDVFLAILAKCNDPSFDELSDSYIHHWFYYSFSVSLVFWCMVHSWISSSFLSSFFEFIFVSEIFQKASLKVYHIQYALGIAQRKIPYKHCSKNRDISLNNSCNSDKISYLYFQQYNVLYFPGK